MKIQKPTLAFLAAIAVGFLVVGAASAQAQKAENPKAEAKYRHDVMEAIGGHMGSMSVILKDQIHIEDLSAHADAIAAMARISPDIFPDGSNTRRSEARDEIWEDPAAFAEAMKMFIEAADDMAAAARSRDMRWIGGAMKTLGGTCKGCHDDFKED